MLEVMGWVGSTLFAACAIPQCIKAYRTKKMNDFSWCFILMWFWGEILTFSYVFITNYMVGVYQIPLLANYFFNFILLCYLIYVKIRYRDQANKCFFK